ncbi:response regulator transcription factor [Halalkalibacterium halodurans]|uniref:LuxR family transcriptional regulator n=1 Tax=Halalkalibacterium halodurans TaxID=86665 RepID=A0A0M0KLW4_ALKHA|nr:response regulator transcription factor [Halalkalibacterium halodurans]MED3647387.1 response regulator transcription factor [Halalkalibacterium halodurans]MED4163524.1 response regulator transcription factor [Halalkalibacterium halodurans]TES52784.1 response regulator transcription factor [Halalkalibacterium halodurans]TPE70709.1 response regulator transcription factor [Halalkalibacterium halodurans]
MANLLLAEDQHLVRQGLKMMIEQDETLHVIAEASNGQEAVEAYERYLIDLVLMDVRMPGKTGLEATKEIRARHPEAKILILTTFADDEYALEALKYGACGYLLKDADADRLIHSIKSALNGGMSLDDTVAAKVLPRLLHQQTGEVEERTARLTKRELAVVKLVGEGKSNQEIADALFLSVGTVKNYISQALDKLELRDRTQLAIYAVKQQLS